MKKSKISMLLLSVLAVTSLASCNIDQPSSSDKNSESDNPNTSINSSIDNPSSDQGGENVDLVSIALNKTSTEIMVESTEQLNVSFTPANASDKSVTWSSSNPAVATVSNSGLVTAVSTGDAVITVKSANHPEITASCNVKVVDNVVISNVDAKHEFVVFDANKAKDSASNDGFYDRTQSYKVGDDNAFNVKPELTVLDAETYLPVSATKWNHDFNISVTLDGATVGNNYYSVVDARNCDIKFTEAAVGKKFTISVCPGGIPSERVTRFTKSITVDVVDGYNVYDAKELGYFDTRAANSEEDSFTLETGARWQCKWTEFKTANGMNPNLHPASLILQKDIKVTTADLPSNYFYTAAEAAQINDARAAGSLHDWAYLYLHTTTDDITLDGNYFALDLSEIPLVTREDHNNTPVGGVISHAAAFKAIKGNSVKFQNINMSGNAKNATSDADNIYGGGFIFVKAAGCADFSAYNMIATKFYITIMSERQYDPNDPKTVFNINYMKCFNNYNSFLYNWGASMNVKNSLFTNCGGPVIIQDHSDTNEYEQQNGMVVLGNPSSTVFEDCSLINYVAGSEAWFQQFEGAVALVPQIKGMSDLLLATGLPKCFVVNEAKEGKAYQALAASGQASFFNFIVVNKSGSAQDLTSNPVSGSVKFIESGKSTLFNYRQPDQDPVAQAYLAYAATGSAEAQQNMIAVAMANGVTFAADFSDVEAKITEYLTNLCTPHVLLRNLNAAGAPVFDLGERFDLLGYDGINSYLQTLPTIASEMQVGTPAVKFQPSTEQLTNMPNYVSLYYNGMMLVFGLTNYVA